MFNYSNVSKDLYHHYLVINEGNAIWWLHLQNHYFITLMHIYKNGAALEILRGS